MKNIDGNFTINWACPKCGGTMVTNNWFASAVRRGYYSREIPDEECIQRNCVSCSHAAYEHPLDKKDEEVSSIHLKADIGPTGP